MIKYCTGLNRASFSVSYFLWNRSKTDLLRTYIFDILRIFSGNAAHFSCRLFLFAAELFFRYYFSVLKWKRMCIELGMEIEITRNDAHMCHILFIV